MLVLWCDKFKVMHCSSILTGKQCTKDGLHLDTLSVWHLLANSGGIIPKLPNDHGQSPIPFASTELLAIIMDRNQGQAHDSPSLKFPPGHHRCIITDVRPVCLLSFGLSFTPRWCTCAWHQLGFHFKTSSTPLSVQLWLSLQCLKQIPSSIYWPWWNFIGLCIAILENRKWLWTKLKMLWRVESREPDYVFSVGEVAA